METQFFFDKQPLGSLAEALCLYPAKEFQSPTRSTVPLFALLKNDAMLESLLGNMGMNANSALHLEYTVKSPKGKGKASYTDLMVRSNEETIALEAKWTEPRYETISEWAKGNNPTNRIKVLDGWLELLSPYATPELRTNDFSTAVYQMVHRAASACYKTKHPHVAYLHFKPDPTTLGASSGQYKEDLLHLKSLLGNPKMFNFYLIEIEIIPTTAYELIKNLSKASAETACKVIAALKGDEQLFEFRDYNIKVI